MTVAAWGVGTIRIDTGVPATITDTFSDANGTNLHGKATTTGGKTWAVSNGTMDVNTGKARPTGGVNDWAYVDAGFSDIDLSVTITQGASNSDGVMFRVVDATHYWRVDLSNTRPGLELHWNDGVTEHLAAVSGVQPLPPGATGILRVLAVGSSIQATWNGGVLVTTPSGVYATATKHGIIGNSLNTRFDDFVLAPG